MNEIVDSSRAEAQAIVEAVMQVRIAFNGDKYFLFKKLLFFLVVQMLPPNPFNVGSL